MPSSTSASVSTSVSSSSRSPAASSSSNLLLQAGTQLYIPDDNFAWIPATVQQDVSSNATCMTVKITSTHNNNNEHDDNDVDNNGHSRQHPEERQVRLTSFLKHHTIGHKYFFPLQNNNNKGNKGDMTQLQYIHEAAILYNIKERFESRLPYTRVGGSNSGGNKDYDVGLMVAVNPYEWMPNLYSEEAQNFYANKLIWDTTNNLTNNSTSATTASTTTTTTYIEPHIYEVSSTSYAHLAKHNQDQTIILSGVSGSGKTVTAKIIMTHLSILEMTRPMSIGGGGGGNSGSGGDGRGSGGMGNSFFSKSMVVSKIIESNTLLEAFGNAAVAQNYNSSRFGKFLRLQFDIQRSADGVDGGGSDATGNESAGTDGRYVHRWRRTSTTATKNNNINNTDQTIIPQTRMAGSHCTTYLLEKSRTTHHPIGERTFHIFYQLFAAPPTFLLQVWKEGFRINESIHAGGARRMAQASDFRYLGSDDVDLLMPGMSDTKNWIATRKALQGFGIVDEELHVLVRALCVVLQLGNLTFEKDPSLLGENSFVSSEGELKKLASLMGVQASVLEKGFTEKLRLVKDITVVQKLSPGDARELCDSFAREMYARIFDFVVEDVINGATDGTKTYSPEKASQFGHISLVDMFGFEKCAENGFDQLCINYANERIQHRYVLDNFKTVTDEYIAEDFGMNDMIDLRMVDNSEVIELLDGKIGVILALNEECIRPNGSDGIFAYKVKVCHENSPKLVNDRHLKSNEFTIRHYADTVKYTVDKFMDNNMDNLPQTLIDIGCQSTNKIIRDQFIQWDKTSVLLAPGIRKQATHTVLSKFRQQLNDLMSSVDGTRTRYVCCIRPNSDSKPLVMDQKDTMSQLESAGIVTAVTIARENFPESLPHRYFLKKFGFLYFQDITHIGMLDPSSMRAGAEFVLKEMLPIEKRNGREEYPWRLGKSKVFFRASSIARIELMLEAYTYAFALRLQAWVRMIQARKKFIAFRHHVLKAQAVCHGRIAQRRYMRVLNVIKKIQGSCRRAIAKNEARGLRQNTAATKISCQWRAFVCSREFKRKVVAARKIQHTVRFGRNKNGFLLRLMEVVDAAKKDEKRVTVQKQIHNFTVTGQPVDDPDLMDDLESIYNNLLEEVAELRRKNSSLTQKVEKSNDALRAQESRMMVAQAEVLVVQSYANRLASLEEARAEEAIKRRARLTLLRAQHKAALRRAEEEKLRIAQTLGQEIRMRNAKIETLSLLLASEQRSRSVEEVKMKSDFDAIEEEYTDEILKLKEELRDTQNAHEDYLGKMMDVLDRTHKAREEEFAKQREKLAETKKEKDAEIYDLRAQILHLQSRVGKFEEPKSSNHDELNLLKKENALLKKRLDVRKMQSSMNKSAGGRHIGL